ncbi:hypothetical protein FSP39_013591 [Pinctada imbricata]|uniref:VWFA domain-containing protein n=1 Tax=Pinctada imbricata TaxID=66713 RepID=A0AA88YQH2_PINIB|nr:hypothetical protein FSP39_013591 [Pinctada imbricata]
MDLEPLDCILSPWREWGPVDQVTGKRVRTRSITRKPVNSGKTCEELEETDLEPLDCILNPWGPWGPVNQVTGERQRSRTVKRKPMNGGEECDELDETDLEPLPCLVSDWTPWTAPNDEGRVFRQRNVTRPDKNGGTECPELEDSKLVPIDCVMGEWSAWKDVDEAGNIARFRVVISQPKNGGDPCPGTKDIKAVKVDCKVGEWEEWGTIPDKQGRVRQYRDVQRQPLNGGKPCPETERKKKVPLDCLVSRWAQWSETFAFGDQVRRRKIRRKPWNGGKPCPKLIDIRKTDKMPTPKKVAEHFGRQFVRPDPQYPRDIIVIIDSSGSIGNELFNRALRDLAELVGYFCPEPDPFVPQNNSFYHRLGVIQFSTGARPPAVAKKQVLILTDGMWNCDGDPVAASKRLQTVADVYGFMIGINSKAGRRKLEKVISEPLLNHLFAVKDFSKFNVVVRQLRTTIKRGRLQCKEFQKP